jgi:hypothetical protein
MFLIPQKWFGGMGDGIRRPECHVVKIPIEAWKDEDGKSGID